jgi:hypothetical protein
MTWLVGSTAGRLVAGILLGGLAGSVFAVVTMAEWTESDWWYREPRMMLAALIYCIPIGLGGALAASLASWEIERRGVGPFLRVTVKSVGVRILAAAFVVVALWAMHQPTLHPAVVVLAAVWLAATSAISIVGIRKDRTAILTA